MKNKKYYNNKYGIYNIKRYFHFDGRKHPKEWINYINNPEEIRKHAFYPFIHYKLEFKKYSKDKERSVKTREIYYSAHIDSYIYQKYANDLSNKYNEYLEQENFNEVSIAYRNNKRGMCNIHFSKEVFEFLKKVEDAIVYVGDFTDFFNNLEHGYLKDKICEVMGKERLSADEYKVFSSIVNFSYINKSDVAKFLKVPDSYLNIIKRSLAPGEFRKLKKVYLNKPPKNKKVGIPQGSPISAVYANVYMIDFDKEVKNLISNLNGIYRRYSDDFIIIIPNPGKKEYYHFIKSLNEINNSVPELILQDKKTKLFKYKNNKISEISKSNLEVEKEDSYIDFLGFKFNGESIQIRNKSITKFYYRSYNKIDRHIKYHRKNEFPNIALIKHLTKVKDRSFLGYVRRTSRIFNEESEISNVLKNAKRKIESRFNPNSNKKAFQK